MEFRLEIEVDYPVGNDEIESIADDIVEAFGNLSTVAHTWLQIHKVDTDCWAKTLIYTEQAIDDE